jgi:4a-hydroxytetrahydrobiopterin dehydratase
MDRRDLLDDAAIETSLADLGWRRDGAALTREVEFRSFRDAIVFVGHVADVAEAMDHHPDIDVRWTTVRLRVTTHDRGGVTPMDVELARRVDALIASTDGASDPAR